MDNREQITFQLTYLHKNCWRSIGAEYQNVAVTMSRSLFPIKVANLLIINTSEQITFQ